MLDVVLPVCNEEKELEPNVRRLHRYLQDRLPYPAMITIADNGSTDRTWETAARLAGELPCVRALHLDAKGRGGAVREAWLSSDAAVVAYMDIDLSTDLDALLPLVAAIFSGYSEVAIGSRLARGARVRRGLKREVISRSYNTLLRLTLGARFTDAQCGFKAVRADVARELLAGVEDGGWFFDTELLLLAQRSGLRIFEVPVDWVDDPDSRVAIVPTAIADLRGMWRVRRRRPQAPGARLSHGGAPPDPPTMTRQIVRFAFVGGLSTLAYSGLFWVLRGAMAAPIANALALLVTAVANTAANRRLTFGVQGRRRLLRDHAGGIVAFGLALAITTGSLTTLHTLWADSSRTVEIAVLTSANIVATLTRFVLLRTWILRPRRTGHAELRSAPEESS